MSGARRTFASEQGPLTELTPRAIAAALALPPSVLSPDPLQKLSGIYISLAAQLESQRQPVAAYKLLLEALRHFGTDPLRPGAVAGEWARTSVPYKLDDKDHIRAIALAQKLGHLAAQISSSRAPPPYPVTAQPSGPTSWLGAAETYLSSSLAAMLKLGLSGVSADPKTREATGGAVVLGRDLDLPDGSTSAEEGEDEVGRVDRRGVGMTMEALSEVYARKGQYDLANQLLLQAISLLRPPSSQVAPPVRDRCQGA
jgi:hypothetical protein